jgi:hypothetical protein
MGVSAITLAILKTAGSHPAGVIVLATAMFIIVPVAWTAFLAHILFNTLGSADLFEEEEEPENYFKICVLTCVGGILSCLGCGSHREEEEPSTEYTVVLTLPKAMDEDHENDKAQKKAPLKVQGPAPTSFNPAIWKHGGGGKIVSMQPQWANDTASHEGPHFKYCQALSAGDVWKMRVEEGDRDALWVGFCGELFEPAMLSETFQCTAMVGLGHGSTAIYSGLSLDGQKHTCKFHLKPYLVTTTPFDIALRCNPDSNMPQIQFNGDIWRDFAPEGGVALKAGPLFPLMALGKTDRVSSFCIEKDGHEKGKQVLSGDADGDGNFDFSCEFTSHLFVEEGRGVTVVSIPDGGCFGKRCLLTGLAGLKAGDLITAVGSDSTLSLSTVEGLEALCQTHVDSTSGSVELTLHHDSCRRRCGPTWRDPPQPGCRYRVEGFYSRCDGVYECEEHKHGNLVVASFVNKENQVRISWNPDKKKWFARCITSHTLFASLRAKSKATWLDELESRRWQEKDMGRASVTVKREIAVAGDGPRRLSAWGSTAVAGFGSGSGSGSNSDGALHSDKGGCLEGMDMDILDDSVYSIVHHEQFDLNEDQSLRAAFDIFDDDRSGYLNKEEFRSVMTMSATHGAHVLDNNEFELLFAQVDTDGSSSICFDEYLQWAKARESSNDTSSQPPKRLPPLLTANSLAATSDGFDFSDGSDEQQRHSARDSDDEDEEEAKRCCLLVCCGMICSGLVRWLGRYLEVAEAGEWLVEGPLNLGLGDYFGSFRFTGRVYWVYLQLKLFFLAVAIVFLPPVPEVQAGIFLLSEIIHLLSVLWVMPFVNWFNHLATVVSSVLAILLYVGFVAGGLAGEASRYSSIYVFVHMAILAQALLTQMWPLLMILAQIFEWVLMALDGTELLGGGDEGPSESVLTLQRATNRLKQTRMFASTKVEAFDQSN